MDDSYAKAKARELLAQACGFPRPDDLGQVVGVASALVVIEGLLRTPAPALPNGAESAISDADIAEWEAFRGEGMVSAVGEYTPQEFWWLLDELKRYRAADNRDAAGVDEKPCKGCGNPVFAWSDDGDARCLDCASTPAAVPAGEAVAVFTNDGTSEAQFIADGENLNCPRCGGSGHVDDTPQPADGEAVAWVVEWIDKGGDPVRFLAHDEDEAAGKVSVLSDAEADTATVLPLYTHPPAAQVQAAPQEGAPRWVDDCQGKASYDGALVSVSVRTWPGNYSADNRPSGKIDVLRLGKVVQSIEVSADTETQLRAEIESKVAKLAAHHSACELVVDQAMVKRAREAIRDFWEKYDGNCDGGEWDRAMMAGLTAALQHRGDSRGGEVDRG